jgi:ribosome modulation factor
MASETDKELAYEAGQQALTEPRERRSVDACPFSAIEHPEERAQWLAGFSDALDAEGELRDALAAAQEELNA